MALEDYRAKRNFSTTPEPPDEVPPQAIGKLQFCVQRHHATRLHYDLRLEVDGVLKSWAVPKGPTLDPAEKRLAMHVEDHPMKYLDFEGNIPKGNYGAGSMMLWDLGSYDVLGDMPAAGQLARGDFKFHLYGQKVSGAFALVRTKRGKGNEWLLLKKRDASATSGWDTEAHAWSVKTGRSQQEIVQELPSKIDTPTAPTSNAATDATSALPSLIQPGSIQPMLAELGTGKPPIGAGWIHEVKWDGVRALCYVSGGTVRISSRNGNAMERQYPELSVLPHHLKARNAVLDGEIAALDAKGVPSFETLQKRIHVDDAATIAALARNHPAVLFLFDLLFLDGRDLRGLPLVERKKLLREILQPGGSIRYSQEFDNGADLLAAAEIQGIEGIVSKRVASFYESRRSRDWIKFKVTQSDSFVLCGFTKGDRDLFGALVLGIYDGSKLTWAGNVGTGFDSKMMRAIHDKLAPLAVEGCPVEPDKNLPKRGTVTWTEPRLVCEVKFANWTSDGRLRAPVWLGFRPDIDPMDCRRAGDAEPDRPALLSPDLAETSVTIDGHRLKFTNLNKVFYPAERYTKRDLLNYYDAVAPLILPHLKDRPLSLKRYPNGIDADFFFQKEVAESFPKWLRTGVADGTRFVIGDGRAELLFLVNLGCIDHNPWMSRLGSLEHPDYLLIDLDPQECGYDKIVQAALLVRAKLDAAELVGYPKTTGGDGMHIFVPLEPRYTYEQVRSFAELLAALVTAELPSLFTSARSVAKREKDRVYFDWAQIAQGKTISAPYVLRAYPGAPVATPLEWKEVVPGLRPTQFHIGNVLRRFDRVGDLFQGVLTKTQALEPALQKLAGGLGAAKR